MDFEYPRLAIDKLINRSLEGSFDSPRPYPNQMFSVSTVPAIREGAAGACMHAFGFLLHMSAHVELAIPT